MSGVAELPLHEGHVPRWLLSYMERLSRALLLVLNEIYGPDKTIDLFSDPLWFQAFNNIIGMDWDSSGSTTVVTAVIKKVSWSEDLGFLVLGGKGEYSRRTIDEIPLAVNRLGLGEEQNDLLTRISRVSAKIDGVLLQDGYSLYHHSLFVSSGGNWVVIQQGMNTNSRMARRYHLSKSSLNLDELINPHTGVASNNILRPINLVDEGSRDTIKVIEDLLKQRSSKILSEIRVINARLKGLGSLTMFSKTPLENTVLIEKRYSVPFYRPINITREFIETINKIQLEEAEKIAEALNIRGFGAEIVRALALVADLIYNAPPSNRDPVTHPIDPFKYSYAHGGKDGVPYRIRREILERTIMTLEEAVERAKLGDKEKLDVLKRLSRYSRSLVED
ncbi:MAG: DUF763 domain-containing protein [Sulfolobales archaeon]